MYVLAKILDDKNDLMSLIKNIITYSYLDRTKIPVVLKTDKESIEVALNTIFTLLGTKPRVILILNALTIRYLLISKVIYDEEKKGGRR